MELEEKSLNSEVVLASAYSVYLGPYNGSFRMKMINKHWSKCLLDRGISLQINRRSDMIFSMETYLNIEPDRINEMEGLEDDHDAYHNSLLVILKLLVGEELCRHWLTLNFSVHGMENLGIMMAPLKRALLVIDPNEKLEGLIDQMTLPDQTVVELDVSQRWIH